MAADARQLLDKHDFKARIGEIEGALDAGDAAADHHHLACDGKTERGQGLVSAGALNRRARDLDRFLGALFLILVHPGALFANVRDFQLERVQAAQRRGVAKCLLVEVRRAARDDDAIELVLLDGVDNRLLPGIGTHVDVVVREDHALVVREFRGHALDIHGRRDVGPAMANENSGAPCQWTAPLFLAADFEAVFITLVERLQIGGEETIGDKARQRLLHGFGRRGAGDGREKAEHDKVGEQAIAQFFGEAGRRDGEDPHAFRIARRLDQILFDDEDAAVDEVGLVFVVGFLRQRDENARRRAIRIKHTRSEIMSCD